MSALPSVMLKLGTKAPPFRLPDTGGKFVSLDDFKAAPALLVVFMCNHCPYVKHVLRDFVELARGYRERDVAVAAINSNDVKTYPEDSPESMARLAEIMKFPFPFLFDADQSVAKAYHAVCTPDFFVFDRHFRLVYRGQMDASRPGNAVPVTGTDLNAAVDAVLGGRPVPSEQKPGIGCNIKWIKGNEPAYFD